LQPCELAGFVDAASTIVMELEAWQKMLSVIGGPYKERWPEEESQIIFTADVFSYKQRITALTFLYGNMRDANLVYMAVYSQLGIDPRDHDHAQRFLADLASGRYDSKYHYFNVLAADWLFLDGTINARRTPPSQLARALLAWERECARTRWAERRWPTLAEQRAFLGL
jgi:hypothetical protein